VQFERNRQPLLAGHATVAFDLFVQCCCRSHGATITVPLQRSKIIQAGVAATGRDGALRRHRAIQARNEIAAPVEFCTIRSAGWTRAGTAQRAVPAILLPRATPEFGAMRGERRCNPLGFVLDG
jgi:hypothetical protein